MVEGECIRKVKEKFVKVFSGYNFKQEKIKIKAKSLTSQQAIGNPQENDYPLLKGKSRLCKHNSKIPLVRRLQICTEIMRELYPKLWR